MSLYIHLDTSKLDCMSPEFKNHIEFMVSMGITHESIQIEGSEQFLASKEVRNSLLQLACFLIKTSGTVIAPFSEASPYFAGVKEGEYTCPNKISEDIWLTSNILLQGYRFPYAQLRKPTLFEHQIDAIELWHKHDNRMLWGHDMGLGKTYTGCHIVYSNMFYKAYSNILIMTLASIVPKWSVLLTSRGIPHTVIDKNTDTYNTKGIQLCSFERIRQSSTFKSANKHQKRRIPVLERFNVRFYEGQFGLIIVDESHKLNNNSNLATQLLRNIITPTTHLLFLSGTPFGNGYVDAFAQMNLLQPGLVASSQSNFYERYCRNVSRSPDYAIWKTIPEREAGLQVLIYSKSDFKKILPGIKLPPFRCDDLSYSLTGEQRKFLRSITKDYVLPLPKNPPDFFKNNFPDGIPVSGPGALLHFSRMVCSGTVKVTCEDGNRSETMVFSVATDKDSLLKDLVEGIRSDQQSIIWVQYTESAKKVLAYLRKLGRKAELIYGATTSEAREGILKNFLDGKFQFLVSNPECIGTGLDFINATEHLMYETPYSGISYEQAKKRSHRIGQDLPVTMRRLYGKGSIEERVIDALDSKIDFMDTLYSSFDFKKVKPIVGHLKLS